MVRDGRALPWPEAMAVFVDSSGRPRPATWELGAYPTGRDDYPVGGISWYEAEAFAAFRGASLPTFYHWARAALQRTNGGPIRGNIVDASNFSGRGPAATHAVGPYGTVDMAGNVREWCVNASGENRWILGGAWTDDTQVHMMVTPNSLPPLDRSATNGVRLAKFAADERSAELEGPVEVARRDFRNVKPVSDEVFEVFKRQLSYTPSAVDAKPVATNTSSPNWTHETVSIEAGYGERMLVHLFVPKAGRTPRQAVVFVPGLGQFLSRQTSPSPAFVDGFDFFVKSGRILVMPVTKGSYERFDGFVSQTGDTNLQGFR